MDPGRISIYQKWNHTCTLDRLAFVSYSSLLLITDYPIYIYIHLSISTRVTATQTINSEARLWNDVFNFSQSYVGIPLGYVCTIPCLSRLFSLTEWLIDWWINSTIRATVLIETILAAFEMDEIIYELRSVSSVLSQSNSWFDSVFVMNELWWLQQWSFCGFELWALGLYF
jgi:hypothetical protein